MHTPIIGQGVLAGKPSTSGAPSGVKRVRNPSFAAALFERSNLPVRRSEGRDGMSALALRRCLGVRRPAVSDRARSLEEVIAVERAGLSSLRPSASRYAILYLPVKGIPASLELGRAVRIPRRRCWPVRESACRKQQCSDRRKRSRQTTFTHFLSPLKPTPCQRQREPTPAGAPSSTVPEERSLVLSPNVCHRAARADPAPGTPPITDTTSVEEGRPKAALLASA